MPLLETSLQQEVVLKQVSETSWKQKSINSLSCKQQPNVILNEIKIFSQNIQKNNFIINTILEIQTFFDIIFIQELSWSFIWSISSSNSKEEEKLVEIFNYLNWIIFARNFSNYDDSPRVITYINIRLSFLCFSLWKDVFNHRDISCVSFFNCSLV